MYTVPFTRGGDSGVVGCRLQRGLGMHDTYQGMYGGCDPLAKRSWTLQETILATRIIIFSSTELQWICRTCRSCEGAHFDSQQSDLSLETVTDPAVAFRFWHRLMQEYSNRLLSNPSDKVPALAGIASKGGLCYWLGIRRWHLEGQHCEGSVLGTTHLRKRTLGRDKAVACTLVLVAICPG